MTVYEKAYAKINLYLDVTGRREDGFHNIVSIMHSVSLCDFLTVTVELAENTSISINVNFSELPTDNSNLIYQAAALYMSTFNVNAKVKVELRKFIPIGAGLGGGSSDAAATLRAMNKIFGCANRNQLLALAAKLGSDVSFCLFGRLALCRGRGEQIAELFFEPNKIFVIAIGESRVSTPKAYAALDELYDNFSNKVDDKMTHLDDKTIIDLLIGANNDIPIYNIFEQVIKSKEIDEIKEIMIKNGAEYSLMSGSGPSVFGCFTTVETAKKVCKKLNEEGYIAAVATSLNIEEEI